jgi:hypothetical protein
MHRAALTCTALLLAALPATALASGGDDDREVRVAGSCDSGATSKLKLKDDDGGIEAEFEVDRNVRGERWTVRLTRGGDVLVRTTATTRGRSGSFSVERRVPAGAGAIRARATGPDGRVCTARATL